MPKSPAVRSNSRALVGILEKAVEMQPDVIYLVSDGSFQWKANGETEDIPWTTLAEAFAAIKHGNQPAELNFVGFQMKPADKSEMTAIVKRSGGEIVQLQKN